MRCSLIVAFLLTGCITPQPSQPLSPEQRAFILQRMQIHQQFAQPYQMPVRQNNSFSCYTIGNQTHCN